MKDEADESGVFMVGVWGSEPPGMMPFWSWMNCELIRLSYVQIVGLRRKLGRCGRYIETVRGVGYRFKE